MRLKLKLHKVKILISIPIFKDMRCETAWCVLEKNIWLRDTGKVMERGECELMNKASDHKALGNHIKKFAQHKQNQLGLIKVFNQGICTVISTF